VTGTASTVPAYRESFIDGVLLAVLFVLLLFGVGLLQVAIDDRFGEYRTTEEILYIEDGEALKKALLGFDSLAADLYWLRTVQYFGGQRLYSTEKRFELLGPLLDITTSLDPHLKVAYTYGATFLSEARPIGAGSPQEGLSLIDKGIENNPEHWRFYLDKGFIYFWVLEDYPKAAEIFLEGSKLPGAPYWMVTTAGRALTRGGDRQTARELWKIMYDTAENDQMRANAKTHLQQLDALDQIEVLTGIATEFQERHGHFPESWNEMIGAGYLPGFPADPTGVRYTLNSRDEKVELSVESSLAGLPTR
jgi:tetratricopeptide (TPR) repeat protein